MGAVHGRRNPQDVTLQTSGDRKRTRRVLFWVGALAAAVRLVYFSEHTQSAFFGAPVLDEKFYDTIARALVEGRDFAAINPGFRPLLYPQFLAVSYRLGGDWGFALASLAQHFLGVLTAVLVAALAIRLHRRPVAGAVAGGLYVLAGPPLFFEGEILITALFTFLVTVLLWILTRAGLGARRAPIWLAVGMWTAFAAQARPNILLFLAAFPAAALLFERRWADEPSSVESRPGMLLRILFGALPVIGVFLVLAVVGVIQKERIGRFQLLPNAGGINFYLGNKAGADGMIPRQDRSITYGEEYRDSVQVFSVEAYAQDHQESVDPLNVDLGAVDPAEVSRYWRARTLREIGDDPGRWLGLMSRKLFFLLWNREIPNNKSYAFIRDQESVLLRYLPVRWWLLLSLGLVGSVHAWRRGDRHLLFWVATLVLFLALGILLFFVNSRYRVPLWPAMAILAGGALPELADRWRERTFGKLGLWVASIVVLVVLSLFNWLAVPAQSHGRDHFFRSLAYWEKGDLERAELDARQSVRLDPDAAAARFQLGNTALAAGHLQLAFESYIAAASLAPGEPRIFNNLGILYERWQRYDDAYRSYLAAIALAGDYGPALVNAALLELRTGLTDRAETRIHRAAVAGHDSVALTAARAFLAEQRGQIREAEKLMDLARRRDPVVAARLESARLPNLSLQDIGARLE